MFQHAGGGPDKQPLPKQQPGSAARCPNAAASPLICGGGESSRPGAWYSCPRQTHRCRQRQPSTDKLTSADRDGQAGRQTETHTHREAIHSKQGCRRQSRTGQPTNPPTLQGFQNYVDARMVDESSFCVFGYAGSRRSTLAFGQGHALHAVWRLTGCLHRRYLPATSRRSADLCFEVVAIELCEIEGNQRASKDPAWAALLARVRLGDGPWRMSRSWWKACFRKKN